MVRLSKPELERFIDDQVKSGRFESREAAIEAAVERMMLEDGELDDATLAAIDEAEDQIGVGRHRGWKEVAANSRQRHLGR